jgi:hypothetical protein
MASRIAFGKTMRPTSSIGTVAFIGNQYANSQIFCQWKVGRGKCGVRVKGRSEGDPAM